MNIVENAAWGNGPAGQWVRAFNAWEEQNVPSDLNISFEAAFQKDDQVYIDYIFVPQEIRAKGWGNKIMGAACELADQFGVILTLSPLWQDDEVEPHMNLIDWYRGFGFYPGDEGLKRYPEGHDDSE